MSLVWHRVHIAVNQYGDTIFIKKHPRKELLEHAYRKHAEKIYVDTISGDTKHIGYIIAGHWYRIYKLSDWKK